ncbi:hypothetical protein PDIG_02970 [Penicillium digitatum PHI26]|uniref:Uncharacterized protein n=2 Tax=Penicillium digitatum TaxID=36651 RepID=K9GC35_PEND2|nr:hypothetical protein PDIP_14220 [Penicillium digitatum Pd1]EKV19500.1 hypothetical protein PDIG_02970 [Penicillium digitatum PHI26]EKV20661.1 hypothetical protein PDIP_14220 [Penicillium digitatum Pd1]
MSHMQSHPSSGNEHLAHEDLDQCRTFTHSDVIHYLYFEDNDGFFPPIWIGKDSQQRPSTENSSNFEDRDTNTSAYKERT